MQLNTKKNPLQLATLRGEVTTDFDIHILNKLKGFELYLQPVFNNFPKKTRYSTLKEIRESLSNFRKCIIAAAIMEKKLKHLRDADIELANLRYLFRFSYEEPNKYISSKAYEIIAQITRELGNMLGAWINKINGRIAIEKQSS